MPLVMMKEPRTIQLIKYQEQGPTSGKLQTIWNFYLRDYWGDLMANWWVSVRRILLEASQFDCLYEKVVYRDPNWKAWKVLILE